MRRSSLLGGLFSGTVGLFRLVVLAVEDSPPLLLLLLFEDDGEDVRMPNKQLSASEPAL